MKRAGIVLAAGMGTRMNSSLPKVLHEVAGLPIIGHVMRAMRGAGLERIVVVSAPEGESVRRFARSEGAENVVAERQLGTGYSAACAREALEGFTGLVAVSYGDQPLLTSATFEKSFAAREKSGLSLVAFTARDPGSYGRVLLDGDGFVERIVEYREASAAERWITLCNAGVFSAESGAFFRWLNSLISGRVQAEYYLTELPALARCERVFCSVALAEEDEAMGVNNRAELMRAEAIMQARMRAHGEASRQ
jgi:bifunctional UDP-N-acetylglucosamine pyrophosphorylase / glucosamine-1-phosphate N-acetyltransferase